MKTKYVKIPLDYLDKFDNTIDLVIFCFLTFLKVDRLTIGNDSIAKLLNISTRTVSRSIKRLEKQKYLECYYWSPDGHEGVYRGIKIRVHTYDKNRIVKLDLETYRILNLDLLSSLLLAYLVYLRDIKDQKELLISKRELSKMFGVSHNTMERAITCLRGSDLVCTSNKGRNGINISLKII